MYPVLHMGMIPLALSFNERANLLSRDAEYSLDVDNTRFQFLIEYGETHLSEAQDMVHATLVSELGDMIAIEAIHIVLLVITIIMSLVFVLFSTRPLEHLVGVESRRLAMLMAEIPRELAVEDAVARMVRNMTDVGEEDDVAEVEGADDIGEAEAAVKTEQVGPAQRPR